jgi:Ran GTPase-activating protein (RanGAP) involved in mRNA processing and transport
MDDLALLIYKKNNKLERVDVSNNKFSFLGANFVFRALTNDKVVKKVNMSSNNLSGGELEDLRYCLKANTSLKYLNLSDCQLNKSIGEVIGSSLGENSVLRTLILSANMLMDKGAVAIAKALETNENLKELDLSKNRITDQAIDSFVTGIVKNKELEVLNMNENEVTDIGGHKLLPAVSKNTQLRKLKLAMNSVGHKYLTEIENYLKKNAIVAEAKRCKMVVAQFALLKERMNHYGEIKKESEQLTNEKRRLKKEIMKGVDMLHEANENKDKDLDCLREELESLYEYEKKLDLEIIDVSAEMQVSLVHNLIGKGKKEEKRI